MNENPAVLFAAAALIVAAISPLLTGFFARRALVNDRAEEHKRQDEKAQEAKKAADKLLRRQDEIAGMAAEAATLLQKRQAEVAEQAKVAAALLIESNEKIAATAAATSRATAASLNAIHTLVNSNLTEAQNRELDATRAMLAAMREVMTLKEARGAEISPATIAAIETVEKRIAILAHDLSHKEVVTAVVDQVLKDQTGEL
jgi:hypothetical protein